MKDALIKIAEEAETLEQRLAALEILAAKEVAQESRIATLEARAAKVEEQETRISALEARIFALEQRLETFAKPQEMPQAEPAKEQQPQAEQAVEESRHEPETLDVVVEPLPIVDELPLAEPAAEPAADAEPIVEPVAEPVAVATEEPVVEPVVESIAEPVAAPVAEPVVESKPAPSSLIGAPVQDIRKAISLGDRFLFQRELFVGSAEKMQKTLDALNGMGTLSEAEAFIEQNFRWDKESTAYELFMNVLKRRFS